MKILHVAYFGETDRLNAIASVLFELSEAQRKIGMDVEICTYSQRKIVDNKSIFKTSTVSEFKTRLDGFRPDIVVFHSLYEYQQILFYPILDKRKIPYIIVFHGGASSDNFKKGKFKKTLANILFWNRFVKKSASVVYLSEAERNKSIFRKINSNDAIISNGVNIPSTIEERKVICPFEVTFVGRIDYYGKGIDLLLDAIKILRDEGLFDKIHFSFYGGKYDETPSLINALKPMAEWYGFVSGDSKSWAYNHAHVFILPSRSEGMPVSVLEALSYGTPCIVTPETNMANVIREHDCGWVTTLNSRDIANTIKIAIDEYAQKKEVYVNNAINAAREYSWESVAKSTSNLYNKVINDTII